MSFATGVGSNLLKLIFNATNWANIADNTATSPANNLYVSLHNANPAESGTQASSETAYTNYARVAVARTTAGWTVSGTDPAQVVNAGFIAFPQGGATGDTLTHWGVGLAASGAGTLIACGPVGPGPALAFTATSASPGTLTVPGSAFSLNDRVSVYHSPVATLPTGLTEGTVYYIGTVSGIAITLSTTTANGNPVNTTAVGAGYLIKQAPIIVSSNITPSFTAAALILQSR